MKVIIKDGNQELVVDEHQRLEINGNTVIVYLPTDKAPSTSHLFSKTNQPNRRIRRKPTTRPVMVKKSSKTISNPKNLKRLIKQGVNIKELIDAGHSIHDIMAILPNKVFKYRQDGTIDMRTFNAGRKKVFSSMIK